MTYFHPERMPVLPARRREAARRQLEEVVKRPAKSGQRRVKPAVILAGVVTFALTTGAAAFAIAEYQPVTDFSHARCYTIAELSPSRNFTIVSYPGIAGIGPQLRHARSACAALYRAGYLTVGVPGERHLPNPGIHAVPTLTVCTMRDHSAAVIPGKPGICEDLGLSLAAPSAATGHPRPGTATPIP